MTGEAATAAVAVVAAAGAGAAPVVALIGAAAPSACLLPPRPRDRRPPRLPPLPRSVSAPAACCSPPSANTLPATPPPRPPRFSSLIFRSLRLSTSARLSSAFVTARTTPPFAPPVALAAFSRRSFSTPPRPLCSRTKKSTIALRCTAFTPAAAVAVAAGSALGLGGVASAAVVGGVVREARNVL